MPLLPASTEHLPVSSAPSTIDATSLVYFDEGDPRNPVNFPPSKKWTITVTACALSGLTAGAVSSYSMGTSTMIQQLHCTSFEATLGLSLYPLGFGLVPLFTSSLSEEFGRFRLYVLTTFLFMLTHVMIALAPNIQTVIVARFLGGSFGSTGATLVGGTIADIWKPNERGIPMALFALAAVGSTGLAPLFAGWIESDDRLGWRWIQWISAIVSGVYFICILLFLTETRSDIILTRIARNMRKMKQDDRYHARAEIDKPGLFTLIRLSSSRPIILLLTEPTVMSVSIWIGFTWGVLIVFVDSISGEMESIYNFNIGEGGSTYACVAIGSIFGWIVNMYQEVLYKKYVARKGPEARLYAAIAAAVLLPTGMLIFAWTARPSIHWIVPLIGLTIFMIGALILYQVSFVYLADCYGPYASSALAGQSLCRNIFATILPLFTQQMYDRLTYKWANTLFALIAVAMTPIPFILFVYGSAIRQRSPISQKILALAEETRALEDRKKLSDSQDV